MEHYVDKHLYFYQALSTLSTLSLFLSSILALSVVVECEESTEICEGTHRFIEYHPPYYHICFHLHTFVWKYD